jgi:hypothetical protein
MSQLHRFVICFSSLTWHLSFVICHCGLFAAFSEHPQYATIIAQPGFSTQDMYKKKKVAALKHRQRQKKLKERRKAQATPKEK